MSRRLGFARGHEDRDCGRLGKEGERRNGFRGRGAYRHFETGLEVWLPDSVKAR